MTYREYIEQLFETLKEQSTFTSDPKKVLPPPEENDNGMLAAFLAVSDPHFIAARKHDPFWYLRARQEIEKLTRQVGSMLNPDADAIEEAVIKFLEEFLARTLDMKALDEDKEVEEEEPEEDQKEGDKESGDEDGEEKDGEELDRMNGEGAGGGSGTASGSGFEGEDGESREKEKSQESSLDDLMEQLFSREGEEEGEEREDEETERYSDENDEEEAEADEADDWGHKEMQDAGADGGSGDSEESGADDGEDTDEKEENSDEGEMQDSIPEPDSEEERSDAFSLEDFHAEEENDQGPGADGIGSGNSKVENRRRENNFLRSIPKGLFELAKLIGRSGSVGFKSGGSFPSASKCDITGITIGDNLSSILPSETALLSCPATQTVFFRNLVEKRLQIFASASSGQVPVEHRDGPVIICLDTSGSMIGEKVDAACNLTMAIAIIAQRRHRDVLVVKYSDWHTLYKVTNMARDREGLVSFLKSYYGNGNSENELFRWLFDEILPAEPSFKSADILCVTDFGWEYLSEKTLRTISAAKRKGLTFYGLNVMDSYDSDEFLDYCDDVMKEVCDSLWIYRNGNCWEVTAGKNQEKTKKPGDKKTKGKKIGKEKAQKRRKIGYL